MKLSEFGGNLLFLEATPYNRNGYEAGRTTLTTTPVSRTEYRGNLASVPRMCGLLGDATDATRRRANPRDGDGRSAAADR